MKASFAFAETAPQSVETKFCSQFRVGGVSVEIFAGCQSDVSLGSRLQSFEAQSAISDIDIQIDRVPYLPMTGERRVFDSGAVWQLYESANELQFDFSTPAMGEGPYKRLVVDRRFRHAHLILGDSRFTGASDSALPLDYPLDELLIMHRLTQEKAIELHGTGIVRANGDANLFVGHSGAGKSTTTRLWTDVEDVEVLSDDRIIVRRDEGEASRPRTDDSVEEVGILRLRDRSASPTGRSAQDDEQIPPSFASPRRRDDKSMRMYGTPWHGEAMFASPNSAALSRIFVLEHGHGNVITPLTPSQAVAELFARSFVPFHRHEYVDSALVFLEELANSVPVYRYSFEPDQSAVEKIRQFRD